MRMFYIPKFFQNAIFGLLLFVRVALKKIRNRAGYSSFFSTPPTQKSSRPKPSILKELGYITVLALLLVGCHSPHSRSQPEESMPDGERNYFKVHPRIEDGRYYKLSKKRFRKSETASDKQAEESYDDSQSYQQTDRDGAPSGPLPTRFKTVKPKREPVSRYGNPDSYEVMGQIYQVITNPTGYKSRGIASWYGTKFHKVRTSSGEKYDMYALTAAHKTLPLPTYVKVKNLDNGREAIVKVNDRGPFHEGRILDLSYAAAVKLGVYPKGTARVEVEALMTNKRTLHYYVQAGAFASVKLAEELRNKLSILSPSLAYIQKHQGRFVVQLGPFADKSMVDQLKQRLDSHGIHGSFSLLM